MENGVGILALGLDVCMIIGFPLRHLPKYLVLGIPACSSIPEDFPCILDIRHWIHKEGIIKEIPEAGGGKRMQSFQYYDFCRLERNSIIQMPGLVVVYRLMDLLP